MGKLANDVFAKSLKDEINFNKRGYEYTNDELAIKLNCHANTVIKKLENPETFSIAELRIIVRTLKINPNTVMKYLYGEDYVAKRS